MRIFVNVLCYNCGYAPPNTDMAKKYGVCETKRARKKVAVFRDAPDENINELKPCKKIRDQFPFGWKNAKIHYHYSKYRQLVYIKKYLL